MTRISALHLVEADRWRDEHDEHRINGPKPKHTTKPDVEGVELLAWATWRTPDGESHIHGPFLSPEMATTEGVPRHARIFFTGSGRKQRVLAGIYRRS